LPFLDRRIKLIQKYLILRDSESGNLTIKEKAVINPIPRGSDASRLTDDDYYLINFVTYSQKEIDSAIKKGHSALVTAIRNPYFFPIKKHCDAITEAIVRICDGDEPSAELFFDTADMGEESRENDI
jgi:hypothetical protein